MTKPTEPAGGYWLTDEQPMPPEVPERRERVERRGTGIRHPHAGPKDKCGLCGHDIRHEVHFRVRGDTDRRTREGALNVSDVRTTRDGDWTVTTLHCPCGRVHVLGEGAPEGDPWRIGSFYDDVPTSGWGVERDIRNGREVAAVVHNRVVARLLATALNTHMMPPVEPGRPSAVGAEIEGTGPISAGGIPEGSAGSDSHSGGGLDEFAVEEAAIALMQAQGGPGVPQRAAARIAIATYLRHAPRPRGAPEGDALREVLREMETVRSHANLMHRVSDPTLGIWIKAVRAALSRPRGDSEPGDWSELRRLVDDGYTEEASQLARRMANDSDRARAHRERLRREGRNPTDCIECGVGDGSHAIGCPRAARPTSESPQEDHGNAD